MKERTFDSVWDAIEPDVGVAQNLKLRSALMMKIAEYVEQSGLTQSEAARCLGTTQPRLNDIIKGRIEKCTVDRLVNMLSEAGFQVDLSVRPAA